MKTASAILFVICFALLGCADGHPQPAALSDDLSDPHQGPVRETAASTVSAKQPENPLEHSVKPIPIVADSSPHPPPIFDKTPPLRGDVEGWIKDYFTQSISVLDHKGRVVERLTRAQLPIPSSGLPFYKSPHSNLILVDALGRELLLDSSEFRVQMAKRQVDKTCDELGVRGRSPGANSPASMGQAGC